MIIFPILEQLANIDLAIAAQVELLFGEDHLRVQPFATHAVFT